MTGEGMICRACYAARFSILVEDILDDDDASSVTLSGDVEEGEAEFWGWTDGEEEEDSGMEDSSLPTEQSEWSEDDADDDEDDDASEYIDRDSPQVYAMELDYDGIS